MANIAQPLYKLRATGKHWLILTVIISIKYFWNGGGK